MPNRRRLNLLCEDRRTERFLRRLCQHHDIEVLSVLIAPAGHGAASEWVKRKYSECVARRRSKNYQKSLGLLVAIDGDNEGVQARHTALDSELTGKGMSLRTPGEPIAVFVPTWSIETWLAFLCGKAGVVEDVSAKEGEGFRHFRDLWKDGKQEAETCKQAASAWRVDVSLLPSLSDAYVESERVGL